MSKNVLIVESVNDRYFIEALMNHINQKNIEISAPICKIDDYECLEGLSEKNLQKRLFELKYSIDIEKNQRIGIILDANKKGIQKRIELINKVLKHVFSIETDMKNPNEFVRDKIRDVEFACFIMNLDGFGELETVLKSIKKKESFYADCLDNWKDCLEDNEKVITDKDFDKFWINIYQRYDCCSRNEIKQAGTKCNFAASMKKDIWNFEHKVLDDLKAFLRMFE